MSGLASLLAALDDTALAAATSRGVVIRAQKDAAGARVGDGTVTVDGQTVTLSPKSLAEARCTCPATGTCRHIVAAIIALRTATPPPEAAPAIDIATLPAAAIEKAAGADWPRALALAATGPQIAGAAGESRTVTFPDTEEAVTFPAGLGLDQALYKGPRPARRRLAVAAAALALGAEAGQALPEHTAPEQVPRTADPRTLDRAEAALCEAAIALSSGNAALAAARLFQTAIATRVEAIPRLAAEVRGLAARLAPGGQNTPVDLLGGLARTQALIRALRACPTDTALLGTLARSFVAAGPRDMLFAGMEVWHTPAGARGLTSFFIDRNSGTFHRATDARAAGTDLTWQPRAALSRPLWGLAAPGQLGGREVHLPEAAMAPDGALGLNQTARFGPGGAALKDVERTGAVLHRWADVSPLIEAQLGRGLRRRRGAALAILAPKRVAAPEFDDYAQEWSWTWHDTDGDALALSFPDDMPAPPQTLADHGRQIEAGLVAFDPDGRVRVLSVWLAGHAAPHSLQFARLPKPTGLSAQVGRLMEDAAARIRPRSTITPPPPDPVALLYERLSEALLSGLCLRVAQPLPPGLLDDARALGQSQVLAAVAALEALAPEARVPALLHLAYVLDLGRTLARGQTKT